MRNALAFGIAVMFVHIAILSYEERQKEKLNEIERDTVTANTWPVGSKYDFQHSKVTDPQFTFYSSPQPDYYMLMVGESGKHQNDYRTICINFRHSGSVVVDRETATITRREQKCGSWEDFNAQ